MKFTEQVSESEEIQEAVKIEKLLKEEANSHQPATRISSAFSISNPQAQGSNKSAFGRKMMNLFREQFKANAINPEGSAEKDRKLSASRESKISHVEEIAEKIKAAKLKTS